MNYHSALRQLETARRPDRGKPVANNTRLHHRSKGGIKGVALKFHSTDIATWYEDGSMHVIGYDSVTTHKRFSGFSTGVRWGWFKPPAYKRVALDKIRWIGIDSDDVKVPYGSFDVTPEGKIDLDSVPTGSIEIITDPVAVRNELKKLRPIIDQAIIRDKFRNPCGYEDAWRWLARHRNKPLDEIDYDGYRRPLTYEDIDFLKHDLAREMDLLHRVTFKEIPVNGITL